MAGLKSLLPMTFWFKRRAYACSLLASLFRRGAVHPLDFLSLPFV